MCAYESDPALYGRTQCTYTRTQSPTEPTHREKPDSMCVRSLVYVVYRLVFFVFCKRRVEQARAGLLTYARSTLHYTTLHYTTYYDREIRTAEVPLLEIPLFPRPG